MKPTSLPLAIFCLMVHLALCIYSAMEDARPTQFSCILKKGEARAERGGEERNVPAPSGLSHHGDALCV